MSTWTEKVGRREGGAYSVKTALVSSGLRVESTFPMFWGKEILNLSKNGNRRRAVGPTESNKQKVEDRRRGEKRGEGRAHKV
jgi:hypothetical protein